MKPERRTAHLAGLALFVGALFFYGMTASVALASPVEDASYYYSGANTYVCASTTTAPTISAAGLSVTTTGLILVNPVGSGVKLVMLDTGVDILASPAAATGLFLAYNLMNSTGVTGALPPATISSAFVGQSTGTFANTKALCYSSAQLPAVPVFFRALGGTTGASAIGGVQLIDREYPIGSVVVPPGGILSLGASSATVMIAHYTWVEVPL